MVRGAEYLTSLRFGLLAVAIGSQGMQAILLSREEVARRGKQLYESRIRQEVEVEENIGKMVIIDIETGDYKVDENGLGAADYLGEKHPNARLVGFKIGYSDGHAIITIPFQCGL